MNFKDYIKHTFSKKRKKQMDKLYNPNQSYITYDKVIDNYPLFSDPFGKLIHPNN